MAVAGLHPVQWHGEPVAPPVWVSLAVAALMVAYSWWVGRSIRRYRRLNAAAGEPDGPVRTYRGFIARGLRHRDPTLAAARAQAWRRQLLALAAVPAALAVMWLSARLRR